MNACSVVLRASELVEAATYQVPQPFNLGRLMIKRLPALSYESAQTDLSSGLRFVAGLEPSSSLLHGTVEQAVCRSSADR